MIETWPLAPIEQQLLDHQREERVANGVAKQQCQAETEIVHHENQHDQEAVDNIEKQETRLNQPTQQHLELTVLVLTPLLVQQVDGKREELVEEAEQEDEQKGPGVLAWFVQVDAPLLEQQMMDTDGQRFGTEVHFHGAGREWAMVVRRHGGDGDGVVFESNVCGCDSGGLLGDGVWGQQSKIVNVWAGFDLAKVKQVGV